MTEATSSIGQSLRRWRRVCKFSQLDLALAANVSARHISFIETGKTHPTREMLLKLADAMELTPEQQNSLLIAAGYTSEKPSSQRNSKAKDIQLIQQLMTQIIGQLAPYPAMVLDANYDMLAINQFFRLIEVIQPSLLIKYKNVFELICAEDGLHQFIINWPQIRHFIIARLREAAFSTSNSRLQQLLTMVTQEEEALLEDSPDTVSAFSTFIHVQFGNIALRFHSVIFIPGTPLDIMPQELRLVVFVPADQETETLLQTLAQ